MLKVGSEFIWLWVAIEPETSQILAQNITKNRNTFVAERFLTRLINTHGKPPVSTDSGTWYPMACRFLKLRHRLHSFFDKEKPDRVNYAVYQRQNRKFG